MAMSDDKNPMAAREKVAVYNHTNEEQGTIVDGEMVSVPAGDGSGGCGFRMVTRRVAELLLKAVGKATAEALRALCLDLLVGKRPGDVAAYLSEKSAARKADE
jgi:hypothetical protein